MDLQKVIMGSLNKDKDEMSVTEVPRLGMHSNDFRQAAHQMVDYIINYNATLGERQTFPDVKPGFMRSLLGNEASVKPEKWADVFADLDEVILKGMTHWQSAGFMAFFPTGNSYPALLGDMLSDALACIGFTWASSPSCTELETVMMDWLAKALELPKFFLHEGKGPGGGVIQGTASEATLVTLLSARSKAIREQLALNPNQSIHDINKRLVAYTSECSHSSVERAGKIALVTTRLLETDENASLRGNTLARVIQEDKKNGRIPIYVCATIGTTSCCTLDNLQEIGSICNRENTWFHVDAAYAGSALLCPELRYIAQGLEMATSFNFNPHKWMMVTFDCSALWFKDSSQVVNAMNMDPLYLRHDEMENAIDYMHWQIPLGRRFRSIKLWFVLRMIGLEGLQSHVRRGVAEAKYFEGLVKKDERFEVLYPVTLGLVCLRLFCNDWDLERSNHVNRNLYDAIHADRRFFITPSCVKGKYFLRISTGSINCSFAKLDECWDVIRTLADEVLKDA